MTGMNGSPAVARDLGRDVLASPMARLSSEYRRRFSSFDDSDVDSKDIVPSEAVLPKEQGYVCIDSFCWYSPLRTEHVHDDAGYRRF